MKTSTTLILLLFAVPTMTQVNAYPLAKARQRVQPILANHIAINNGVDRTVGESFFEDDFSDLTHWIMTPLVETANWEIATSEPEDVLEYVGPISSTTAANGFGLFNGVQYLLAETVTSQDAVMTYYQSIDCSSLSHITLEFEQCYRHFEYDKTSVEISDNDGLTYDYSFDVNTNARPHGITTRELVRINISEAAAGKEFVKIRFRWSSLEDDFYCGSVYAWMIDDLVLVDSWNNDQKVLTTYQRAGIGGYMPDGMDYYQFSNRQHDDLYFSAISENMGAQVQENAKLNLSITGGAPFLENSLLINFPINTTDSFAIASPFDPIDNGTYSINYWMDSDSTDQYTTNDSAYSTIEKTDAYFSRHTGIAESTLNNVVYNIGNPLLIGNVMDIFADELLCMLKIYVSNEESNIGKDIFGMLMLYDETTDTFIYLDQTPDHTITPDEIGGPILLILEHSIKLHSGQSVLLLAGHYGNPDWADGSEVGFQVAQKTTEQTVLGYTSGATEPFYLENPGAIMISMYFNTTCEESIDEAEVRNLGLFQNFPNPVTNVTVINYSIEKAENLNVIITDLTGKQLENIELGPQKPGDHQFELNIANYESGVYFYTFSTETESLTKKMIIQ